VSPCHVCRLREPSEDAIEEVGGGAQPPSAPTVGVLMELIAAVRCPDGRLIVLACGVGRLRVGVMSHKVFICLHALALGREVATACCAAAQATRLTVLACGVGRPRVGAQADPRSNACNASYYIQVSCMTAVSGEKLRQHAEYEHRVSHMLAEALCLLHSGDVSFSGRRCQTLSDADTGDFADPGGAGDAGGAVHARRLPRLSRR